MRSVYEARGIRQHRRVGTKLSPATPSVGPLDMNNASQVCIAARDSGAAALTALLRAGADANVTASVTVLDQRLVRTRLHVRHSEVTMSSRVAEELRRRRTAANLTVGGWGRAPTCGRSSWSTLGAQVRGSLPHSLEHRWPAINAAVALYRNNRAFADAVDRSFANEPKAFAANVNYCNSEVVARIRWTLGITQ